MAFWQPVTNLRDYVSQNPPAVTFMLCLLTLAFSFISLSFYSSTHTLPNPDTSTDWNHLLSALSQFHLCAKANLSSNEPVSPAPSPLVKKEIHANTSVNSTKTPPVNSLYLSVPLTVTTLSNSVSLRNMDLYTTLHASQLRLGGNEMVSVTIHILSEKETYTCLTISAPTDILPMSLLPPKCPASESNLSPIHVKASKQQPTASQLCYNLHSQNDPKLTVMLTKEEKGVAVRHLLEVSMCLLGVCLILCIAASLTHSLMRSQHWKGLDLQNEPLIDS
ncbi:transmembrane protein 248 [Aulostomus maculatus]